MSRAHRNVRPKIHRVYSVHQVLNLYGIHRNTLVNWVRAGLRPSTSPGPQLFRGLELHRFHTQRRGTNQVKMKLGEFYCMACKSRCFPALANLNFRPHSAAERCSARCPECAGQVSKIMSASECDTLRQARDTNTKLYIQDDMETQSPAEIVTQLQPDPLLCHTSNDFTLHRWQKFAVHLDTKTVDKYLATIREFEMFLEGKRFETVDEDDVA